MVSEHDAIGQFDICVEFPNRQGYFTQNYFAPITVQQLKFEILKIMGKPLANVCWLEITDGKITLDDVYTIDKTMRLIAVWNLQRRGG
jgi:hypothetical protein